jgi:DNA-binding IclR family transcriptional regulator
MTDTERGGIQVIARASAILRSLAHEPEGLSLADIAARVSLPRSTVQRIVAALSDEQLLMPASLRARVKLGPALTHLASAVNVGVEKLARPLMQELARLTNETVDLSVLQGSSVVFVEQIQGTQRLIAISAVGKEFPLHCTANGKALLALLPPVRRASLMSGKLARFTPRTITDPNALGAELTEVARRGLAYDLEEHSVGISAVGCAFTDSLGREYSLSIPVPSARFESKKAQLSKLLKKTLEQLLQQIHRLPS